MNNYETVGIVKPDVPDDAVKAIIQKASNAVTSDGGEITKLDEWGRRRLAYPIEKKNEGYYFVLEYRSNPAASKEVERLLQLNEDVLRYQTVRIEKRQKAEAKAAEARTERANAKAAAAAAKASSEGGAA